MHLQTLLHLPTRQRHDGHHENLISRTLGRKRLLKSSILLALPTAILMPGIAKADPKPVGTWGWTTGSATYVRIRPGQQTPIVAKVSRRTQIMVWGTFDGWYRVETTDHKFGWVYHDYVNVPKADKLHKLSHFKAKKASDATGHQVLYGNPQQLKKYYAHYKAPGAKKGLEKQGITLVSTSKTKAAPKVVLASTKVPAKNTKVKVASRPAPRPMDAAASNVVVTVSTPDTNIAPRVPETTKEKPRTVVATTVRPVEARAPKTVETTPVVVQVPVPAGKAPSISATDIMNARAEYIRNAPKSRHKTAPYQFKKPQTTEDTVTVTAQPSSMDVDSIRTSPTPIKNGTTTSASPISGEPAKPVKATFSRGGSPRDLAKWGQANNKFGNEMADQALSYRGMPYISGGTNPNRGFDCSGLVYFLLRQRGYNPPRTSDSMVSVGRPVEKSELRRGDIVFFANTYKSGVSHVGVYIGNNNFVHAANSGAGVRVDSLNSSYYGGHYWGARRVK